MKSLDGKEILSLKNNKCGTSLAVQRLGLWALTAKVPASIPARSQKKKRNQRKKIDWFICIKLLYSKKQN